MDAAAAEHTEHTLRVREENDAAVADVGDRGRAVCEPVRVVGSIEIAGARTGYCIVTVAPDPPLRRDGQLGQRVVELLVRDHRPEAGREERIVRPAQLRRRPDDALRRAHQDDTIVVTVRDQQISGKRTAKNGRQAEDTLRGPRRRLERRERASHRLQLTGRRRSRGVLRRRRAAGGGERGGRDPGAAHQACLPVHALSLR